MRRGLVVAVLLCLAGAGLLLLATSRVWLSYRLDGAASFPRRTVALTGSELAPGARALGFLALAGVAALAATRSWGRVLVGALLALAGAGAVAVLVRALADRAAAVDRAGPLIDVHVGDVPGLGPWPYVGLVGAGLLLAAGVLVMVRGRSWTTLGANYEAPAATKPAGDASLWDALDRGEDPTGSPSDDPG
jgi:uncharacterized membrane protein (TIGR02234 family)